jgi:FAD synthase
VHLAFFHRLRDERKFESLQALKEQMDRDVQQVAELMG